MTFQERIQTLVTEGAKVERPEHGKFYQHEDGTELMRCTTYLMAGEEFYLPTKWKGALDIGTDADQMVRDYFVDGPETLRSYNYDHMTQEAFNGLLDGLNKLADSLSDEWTVFADRLFLYSLSLGVAGEIDLLLVNYLREEVVIVDLKTVRTPKYMTPGSDKVKKYHKQLNVYRTMAEEMMGGLEVDKMFVLPIHVAYPAYGDVTTRADFLDWMDIEGDDVVTRIEEQWQANKGMTSTEYMEMKKDADNDPDNWLSMLHTL